MSRRNPTVAIISGMALLLAFHMIFAMILIVIFVISSAAFAQAYGGIVWIFPIFGIGLAQLLYVVPACIYFHRQGHSMLVQGMLIGAVITALLNGGCYLLLTQAVGG
jgi:nitrate reductase NapE component